MQAQDVMTKNVITAAADTTVEEVTVLMMDNHISAIPIVDGAGSIVGIVSEGDLMRRVEKPGKVQKSWWLSLFSGSDNTAEDFIAMRGRHAGDIMSRKVEVVAANTPVSDIARLLEKKTDQACSCRHRWPTDRDCQSSQPVAGACDSNNRDARHVCQRPPKARDCSRGVGGGARAEPRPSQCRRRRQPRGCLGDCRNERPRKRCTSGA